MRRKRLPALLFILAVAGALFWGYGAMGQAGGAPLAQAYLERGIRETGAQNLVCAIYLDYRLFDTLLEALLLLVSVIGVTQASRLTGQECNHPNVNRLSDASRLQPSQLMRGSLDGVYLLIGLFGVYVVITGMDGPGGGFQGGAILAAIVITAHFAQRRQLLGLHAAERVEKVMYVLILAAGMIYLVGYEGWDPGQRRLYLLAMNVFIGVKVFSGLSLIYLRFMGSRSWEAEE